MMEYFHQGYLHPIRLARVSNATEIQETFEYMQQGKHIGKIVLELRDNITGKLWLGNVSLPKKSSAELDASASYLLVGGLGGIGRSISLWMAQHGAKNFTFLTRNAGSRSHDQDFVNELESMGCKAVLVKGDVTDVVDVSRAVNGPPRSGF
jgi:hypothetical protein